MDEFLEENKNAHLLQIDLKDKDKFVGLMSKLENLFVYYEIDEEFGKGMKASILVDKSG